MCPFVIICSPWSSYRDFLTCWFDPLRKFKFEFKRLSGWTTWATWCIYWYIDVYIYIIYNIYIYIFAHKHITLQCCLRVAFFARFRLESPSHVRRFLSLIAVPGQTRHYMWLHVPSCAPCLSALKANQEKGIGIIIKIVFWSQSFETFRLALVHHRAHGAKDAKEDAKEQGQSSNDGARAPRRSVEGGSEDFVVSDANSATHSGR